jgi:hypothetical protein
MPVPGHTPSGWLRSGCRHGDAGCCWQIQPSRHFPHVLGSLMPDSVLPRGTGQRRARWCVHRARARGGRRGSDIPSSGAAGLARAQSGYYRRDTSRALPSRGSQPARSMAIFERAARAAFEKVPAFDRLHAIQHRRPIDERPLALRTEELRGRRLRGGRELWSPALFHCLGRQA